MNVKDNLKEIDRDSCIKKWEGFKASHDREIERLRTSIRTIASMGV